MTIELQVDRGVPLLDDEPFCDLKVRVAAACETINYLAAVDDTEHAKIRLRALELLGKISDVGLFAEKSEVTITHQSTDDLRANLRKKLEKLVKEVEPDLMPDNVEEAEWVNVDDQPETTIEFEGAVLDVDAEMYGESKNE